VNNWKTLKDIEIAELKAKIKEFELEREEVKKAVKNLSLYLQVEAI